MHVSEDQSYAQLEEYLKNGQWEKADNETYRLMITTVGKEEGQWFDPEELLNFPCEELLAIDGLWVKYSNGRFGFSVQKQIYLDCGGVPDGKYYGEAWQKLCHKIGWKVNYRFERIFFSTSAPEAHLPACQLSSFKNGYEGKTRTEEREIDWDYDLMERYVISRIECMIFGYAFKAGKKQDEEFV